MNTTWPPPGVTQRMLDLKELQSVVRNCSGREPYAPHLSRYLVVRSAGLIEAVRDDVADQYCKAVSSPRAHRRVTHGLRGGTGVRPKQLIDFVKTFDIDWANDLETWLENDDYNRKDRLGALVASRIKIAHGDGTSVSISQALPWADTALETANWFISKFDPQTRE